MLKIVIKREEQGKGNLLECGRKKEKESRKDFENAALTGGRTSESNEVVDILQVLVRLAVTSNQP